MLKAAAEGLTVGPLLLGLAKPLNVLVPSVTARGIVNVTAIMVRAAQERAREQAAADAVAGPDR
jgi:malate dehydrogenase (oxaloacetate-decarboxylating)(NADP+)